LLDPKVKKRVIKEGLEPYLKDNMNAWEMLPDSSYRRRPTRKGAAFSAQRFLISEYGQEVPLELS
jgi:polyphosphate kinase